MSCGYQIASNWFRPPDGFNTGNQPATSNYRSTFSPLEFPGRQRLPTTDIGYALKSWESEYTSQFSTMRPITSSSPYMYSFLKPDQTRPKPNTIPSRADAGSNNGKYGIPKRPGGLPRLPNQFGRKLNDLNTLGNFGRPNFDNKRGPVSSGAYFGSGDGPNITRFIGGKKQDPFPKAYIADDKPSKRFKPLEKVPKQELPPLPKGFGRRKLKRKEKRIAEKNKEKLSSSHSNSHSSSDGQSSFSHDSDKERLSNSEKRISRRNTLVWKQEHLHHMPHKLSVPKQENKPVDDDDDEYILVKRVTVRYLNKDGEPLIPP